jgi:2-deoxy-D-gluconate 3-dehydrogenase
MGVLDDFKLDGRRALVTGCNRGIGQALALGLAEAGADIVGVSRTLKPGASAVEDAVTGIGRKFAGYTADLADRTALYRFIDQVKSDFDVIDILVNSAGIIERRPIEAHTDETWDRVIETNLTAQFILSRELGREMVARGSGKIILIASVLAFQGGLGVPSYAASKGGVVQLVKSLSNEWAGTGVHVNGLAPGYVITDATAEIREDSNRSEDILKRIPAGRWGEPGDFKGAVVFLASRASDYMHGGVIAIDGGWLGR